ncbi:MAG: TIGR02680 family protein, partial [Candidatus Sericytochromatia bacterium]|nr:TIGR02680 family protein [Candidatus Tanganyikabacteria bacterium]
MIPDPVQAEMVVPVTQGSGQGTPLPEPRKTRWQPLRSGFLNVFRFDREEFWYEDGHLLLRGNNGTGKSRVLALQLPFLLDGEAASHRLEPDGDPAKRLEWNLLMGRHEDRLGYTWIEFGRLDEGGVAHFVTLGCGIHASQGRSPGRWHFVTRQRIGRDLFLQMPDGTAIGREALEHAIGTAGQVFTQVDRYRRAVDQVLFRLGDRYEALLDLLIQLRKPQLSRELDEKRLSRALSEALPPLGRSVLDDVADAFRELEKDREQLAGLDTARAATEKFHGRYLRYAQAAVRRRAQDVLGAHRDFDLTMRKLREAESERDEAGQKRDHAQGELDRLKSRAGVLDQEIKTFESSPEMRGKEALDSAARAVQDRKGYFDQAGLNALKADQTRRKRHDDLDSAKARSARSLEVLATATCAAAKTAGEADLANAHTGAIGSLGLPDVVSREAATIADGRIRKAIDDRFAAIKTLQSLADVKAEKEADWKQARETREKADRDRESAIEARQQAVQDHETFVEDLWQRFEGWLGSLRHLAFPAGAVEATVPDDESGLSWLEDLGDRFRAWSDAPGGPGPFAEAVTEARDRAVRRLARQESEFQVLLGDAEARRIELESERERLLAGVHLPPPAPYTRDPGVRDDRDGAPLWALCDFAEQMSESDRAGLEAALEGAGLLDAWVTPEGHLVLPGEHDAFLVAPTAPPAEEGQTLDPGLGQRPTRTLDQALVVAIDPADARASSVAPEMLERILAQISLKETHLETAGRNWVSVDGCWQLGPLRGSWMKPEAEHIGAGAREASRKRRLADVIAKLEQTAAEIEDLGRRLEGVARELKATDDEARRAPQEAPLFLLVAARNEAIKREREAAERQDQAGRVEAEQRRAFNRAVEDLGQAAADLGLGSWIDDLGGLRDVTERYRRSVDQLDTAIGRHLDGLEAVAAAARLVEEAGRELARHQEALAIA